MTAAKNKNGYIQADITQLSQYADFVRQNGLGEYKLTIVASAPGYLDSDPSQEVTFINGYPIAFQVTNCTYSPDVAMVSAFESTTFTFEKSTGYSLPSLISVTDVAGQNIGYSWTVASDGLTATLVITEPTGAVTVTVAGDAEVYSITVSAPHTTHTGATTITYGQTATLVFTFDKGYEAPDETDITVTGADFTWEKGTGTMVLSNARGAVNIELTAVAKTYAIRVEGTHASATDGSPTTIKYGGTATLSFDYDRGYFAPASVTVNNATGNWNQGTNELVITNPLGDVTVTIEAMEKTYDIKYDLTNLTSASSNPRTITSAATGVELAISGSAYYALPTSITVSGVAAGDWSYDRATGKVTLSYPTGTVTIKAVGVEITETIKGIWSWNTTIPDGMWTEQAVNFTSNGGSYSGMEWDGYDLYYVVAADGTKQKVYSFNKDTQVGTWENGGERSYWRIVDFGTTGETVSKIFADYVRANAVQSGKLATPAGVQVADASASWDEVANATEYEIIVNNVSWGVCKPTVYNYTQDGDTVTIQNAPYTQDGDTVTIT